MDIIVFAFFNEPFVLFTPEEYERLVREREQHYAEELRRLQEEYGTVIIVP